MLCILASKRVLPTLFTSPNQLFQHFCSLTDQYLTLVDLFFTVFFPHSLHFSDFFLFFKENDAKVLKKLISTSKRHAKHPHAGQNTHHP